MSSKKHNIDAMNYAARTYSIKMINLRKEEDNELLEEIKLAKQNGINTTAFFRGIATGDFTDLNSR